LLCTALSLLAHAAGGAGGAAAAEAAAKLCLRVLVPQPLEVELCTS
jgi:hypothetical protein